MNIDKEKERQWQLWCEEREQMGASIPPWFPGMFDQEDDQ
jgi:hypothetical protein